MDRRFLAWVVISLGLWLLYVQFVAPPPRPPRGEDAAKEPAADANDEKPMPQLVEGAPPEPAEDGVAEPAPPPVAAAAQDVPPELVTLGSVDPEGSHRMLLTATNVGAAIRRAELANLHYRDLHDEGGYLGSLEAIQAKGGGALVRAVGAGTPAAAAGLRVGDVIKTIGKTQIKNARELQVALGKTKPRDRISLVVERDGQTLRPIEVTLVRPPQEVMRPERENLASREAELEKPLAEKDDAPSFLLTLEQLGDVRLEEGERELPQVDLLTSAWEIVPADADEQDYLMAPGGPDEVVFRKVLPEARLEVYKRYKIARVPGKERTNEDFPAYHFELEVGLRNLGAEPRSVAYRLDGPTGLPTEGWWYVSRVGRGWFESSGLRDVIARFVDRPTSQFSARAIAEEEDELQGGRPLVYAGADSLYFASILIPQKKNLSEQWFADVESVLLEPELKPSDNLSLSNVTCRLIREALTLDPGESHTESFTVFCGPKRPELLEQYKPAENADYSLDDLVYYGWFWWVAGPMLGILTFFYGVVRNYGIAIIMLTILVRACMLPLSLKQAKNMAKMQELQPEMQRIAEKYKGDMEKRARAQQDLFRKHNYNPMGGCLMAFIQLPIFVGLYRGLMLDVELRQAPLFTEAIRWCSNLGAPDMLVDWSDWMPDFIQGFLGPYFNLLPIITIFLFLLQQKLFMPPPTNEQAAMQQKIMKFMMIFIGFLFYKVASGLCLYFIASSVWGIVERKLIPRPTPEVVAATSGDTTGVARRDRTGDRPARNGQPSSRAKAKSRRKK